MAHVQPVRRPGRNGKSVTKYRARWTDPAGKECCKTFDLKRDANKHLETVAAEMLTGRYADPADGKITIRAYAEDWVASLRLEPSTLDKKRGDLARHVYPTFGDRPIGSIRPTEVRGWITGLARRYPDSEMARNLAYLLFGLFKAAVGDRVIGIDPCEGVEPPEKARKRVSIPTKAQVGALIEAAPARYRAAVYMAAGGGLRQSEMTGLTLDRLTLPLGTPVLGVARSDEPTVRIDQQLACLTGQAPALKPKPKTRGGVRTVPMADDVASALTAHLAAFPVTHPWGLVFTTEAGEPITRKDWSTIWRAIREAAGVPGVRYHDLRHYAVSSVIRHGATIIEAQEFAGHATSSQTLDTYGHLWEDSEDRIRAGLNAGLDFGEDDGLGGVLAVV